MGMIKTVLDFIQNELLGMRWLEILTASFLKKIGVDIDSKLGGSIHFFLYDVIHIVILLVVLVMMLSYIQSYFPPERTKKILGKFHGIWANIVAALFGTITSFCSCSSIPIFIGFTSAGLPIGVTFSFLISSPMVDFASFVILISTFGWRVATLYVITGLLIAIIGGKIIGRLQMEEQIADFIYKTEQREIRIKNLHQKERILAAFREAVKTVRKMIPYIMVGVGIGAFIHNCIPETIVVDILGKNNPFGVLIAAVVGAPIYADVFGTISVARSLLEKGANLGVVLAFMMSITTLSLPSIIMLRKVIKTKLLCVFVGICIIGIVLVGYLFNLTQYMLL